MVVNGFRLRGLNYASLFMRDSRNELDEEDTNLLIKNLNINLNDDFYTALLNGNFGNHTGGEVKLYYRIKSS